MFGRVLPWIFGGKEGMGNFGSAVKTDDFKLTRDTPPSADTLTILNIALREAGTGNGERGTVDSQIVSGFINVLTNLRSAIQL